MKPYVERLPEVFYCRVPGGRVTHIRQGDREDRRTGPKTLCGRPLTTVLRRDRCARLCPRCRARA